MTVTEHDVREVFRAIVKTTVTLIAVAFALGLLTGWVIWS